MSQALNAGRTAPVLAVLVLSACGRSPTEPVPAEPTPPPSECGTATTYSTGDPALDSLQQYFRPVLESNRKSFVGRTGTVQGFGAGAVYPQVWLRDSATILPATRYFFGAPFLTSWLEEHLSHQRDNGALWDWIASGDPAQFVRDAPHVAQVYSQGSVVLSADKNTTAADQEASAVDAAWQAFQITGDRGWLRKPVAGRPLVERLDAALSYVEQERLDEGFGLVASGLTADWGDVSPAYADQRAIYLDDRTPVVVGLYANAFFARAADELAALLDAAGDPSRAGRWRAVAESVRGGIDRHLWDEPAGFYRMHRVVAARGAAGEFDDSDIFALGGNALAALYGPADGTRSARIFAVADSRRRSLGLSTIAGVLMPPYPTGFFLHPILREAFTYQNGGQWDWWSGRFVLAMFRQGHSRDALAALLAVARRAVDSGGLYEWHSRDGRGQGSAQYAGNTGALAGAIYEGLFGLASSAGGLDVTVRLGSTSGSVRTCEPASSREVRYEYAFAAQTGRVTLAFQSNAPGSGRLALRLPESLTAESLLVDGRPMAFDRETRGDDEYVSFATDWASHRLELQLR